MEVNKEILIGVLESRFNLLIEELKKDNNGDYDITSDENIFTCKAFLNKESFVNIAISYSNPKLNISTLLKYRFPNRTDKWIDINVENPNNKLFMFSSSRYNSFGSTKEFIVSNNTKEEDYKKLEKYLDDKLDGMNIGLGECRNYIFTPRAADHISSLEEFKDIIFYKID